MRRCLVLLMSMAAPWAMLAPPAYSLAAEKQNPPTTNPAGPRVVELTIPRTVVRFKMVKIPAGTIEMPPLKEGEKPQKVEIKSFWMGRTEVTWDEFDVWALALDLNPEDRAAATVGNTRPSIDAYRYYKGNIDWSFGHTECPAGGISSHAAKVYCGWLAETTRRKFRVPTEAEWEYACRAGGPAQVPDARLLKETAWFKGNSENSDGDPAPHPIAQKKPNAWGLYDVLGNMAEWVEAADGSYVAKGGSYRSPDAQMATASRLLYRPAWQVRDPQIPKDKWLFSDAPFAGFRIVMDE